MTPFRSFLVLTSKWFVTSFQYGDSPPWIERHWVGRPVTKWLIFLPR